LSREEGGQAEKERDEHPTQYFTGSRLAARSKATSAPLIPALVPVMATRSITEGSICWIIN
jgi:hypothetical protein